MSGLSYPEILFLLLAAHCLCDYPLQGDFLAQAKNPWTPVGRSLWYMALPSHGLIHGAAVFVITGSLTLGVLEAWAHMAIDLLKCRDLINFRDDQVLHVVCKLAWLAVLMVTA